MNRPHVGDTTDVPTYIPRVNVPDGLGDTSMAATRWN